VCEHLTFNRGRVWHWMIGLMVGFRYDGVTGVLCGGLAPYI